MRLGRDMQRILVGVDFSPESEAAIRTAFTFARAFDAIITLLHVHELLGHLVAVPPLFRIGVDRPEDRDHPGMGLVRL